MATDSNFLASTNSTLYRRTPGQKSPARLPSGTQLRGGLPQGNFFIGTRPASPLSHNNLHKKNDEGNDPPAPRASRPKRKVARWQSHQTAPQSREGHNLRAFGAQKLTLHANSVAGFELTLLQNALTPEVQPRLAVLGYRGL